jgi:hypothetical protein
MQNMFKNKGMKTTYKQVVVKPKVTNPWIHMVDVNMAITKKQGYWRTCVQGHTTNQKEICC